MITAEDKVFEMTALSHQDTTMKIAEDVCGCIQSPTRGTVMILDTGALLRRCFRNAGDKALGSADLPGAARQGQGPLKH